MNTPLYYPPSHKKLNHMNTTTINKGSLSLSLRKTGEEWTIFYRSLLTVFQKFISQIICFSVHFVLYSG